MPRAGPDARVLYLDLMERCLLDTIYTDPPSGPWKVPSQAHTMIGQPRMANLRQVVEQVLVERVPGDLIETGVWRGGACIYMRAILLAHGIKDRRVLVADSFEGVPPPNAEKYPADEGSQFHAASELAVPLEEVRSNFARYGLLDDQVVFLKGLFRDTLPNAPVERLAVLRLDGDMYESTMDALVNLYDRVSPGGFVIVDDYNDWMSAHRAVMDFRAMRAISEPVVNIDGGAVYWQKRVTSGGRVK